MRYFTRQEAAKLARVCTATLGQLKMRGIIEASGRLTIGQVLALAIAKGLTLRGTPWRNAGDILTYLWEMPPERLEANFSRGARYILVIGDQACPRLMTMDAIKNPTGVDPAEVARLGLMPCSVDAQAVYDRLVREIAEMDAQKEREAVSAG